jgi:hypothetical protein
LDRIGEQPKDGCRKGARIFRGNKEPSDPIFHGLCVPAHIGGNNRKRRRHGLDDGIGETSVALGKNENVDGSKNVAADSRLRRRNGHHWKEASTYHARSSPAKNLIKRRS